MSSYTWGIDTSNNICNNNNNNNTPYTYSSTTLGTPISTTINFNGEQLTKEDVQFLHSLKEKEEIMNNFHFGPCGDRAKISHLGIAVKNVSNNWVSYDKSTDEIVDVDLISFGDGDYVYMLPVAIKDIAPGDAIIHHNHVVFVKSIKGNKIKVIDVTAGEEKKIVPAKSIFGFDFVTKVVSLLDFSKDTANQDNPFGNMLPFMLMSNKKDDALPLVMMMTMNKGQNLDSFSTVIPALLLSQKTESFSEILSMMWMAQQMN